MTLIRKSTNKTLKGHKAIIITTIEPPQSRIDAIQKQFPDLKIITRVLGWGQPFPDDFPHHEWKDTTLLLTSTSLPKPEQAPNVQYVQLTSAGANFIVEDPFFAKTNIPFSTANGVHG